MASLDISEVLDDPLFNDAATLERRAISINQYGESVITSTSEPIVVVAYSAGDDIRKMMPEGSLLDDIIEVISKTNIKVDADGRIGDAVIWNGKRYIAIKTVGDYTNFGEGFVHVICKLEIDG